MIRGCFREQNDCREYLGSGEEDRKGQGVSHKRDGMSRNFEVASTRCVLRKDDECNCVSSGEDLETSCWK